VSDERRRDRNDRGDADDEPVLPEVTRDERETGWGDDPESAPRDEHWYRRERPPHHE
jgi:hypothetical protein